MAWDSARQRVVLFGGQSGLTQLSMTILSDTWEYDPSTRSWTQRAVTGGPPARVVMAMAYDPVRAVTVLFGGWTGTTRLADTWEWNGTTWTQRVVTGPAPRHFVGCWWDPVRARISVYGGYDRTNGNASDTWDWNGTAWTQRTGLSGLLPDGAVHSVAYDAVRQRMVFHGGRDSAGPQSGTWELGTTWSNPASTNPPSARFGAAMTWDATSGRALLVGGNDGVDAVGGAWSWDGATWAPLASTAGVRAMANMVFDSSRGKVILFGGYNVSSNTAETWEY